ncbi:hypothetical protein [Acidiferrobacter sp.]|uniref:hypothetical protein n=1 Tax=Acidiferrobacter sp. TaxID=1872107 RepID=UPI00262C40A4|nr:hypothetical protein [Acidiferrobacter sp.]
MEKVVIKITVYKELDPDLYESVSGLPLRQRAALIRRLWREGLIPGGRPTETHELMVLPATDLAGQPEPAADNNGADKELLRKDLATQGLSVLSAFV